MYQSTIIMARKNDGGCGQTVCVLLFVACLFVLGWLTSLEGPTQIAAGAALGSVVLLSFIGKGRAVQKGEPIWWLCTPVQGFVTVIALLFALPFVVKIYFMALCNCSKEASTPQHNLRLRGLRLSFWCMYCRALCCTCTYTKGVSTSDRTHSVPAAATDVTESAEVSKVLVVVQGTLVEQPPVAV